MDQQQFYPTPPSLAKKLWAKFENQRFSRVLEPSAGMGDLIKSMPHYTESRNYRNMAVDCIEIDMRRHAALREMGCQVVGMDFLEHTSGSIYSHIVQNPPFNAGAAHCLKAWDILWSGEVASILAAETIRNPFSAERKRLLKLIEGHGSVEFVQEAFLDPDTQRKTDVEVALVHLVKKAPLESLMGDLVGELQQDLNSAEGMGREFKEQRELALPNSTIENTVVVFNAAVRSMKESVLSRAKANYYAKLLGDTMAVRTGETGRGIPEGDTEQFVRATTYTEYQELKDRAWAAILHSSQVTSKLSSAAAKQIESDFEKIKALELTAKNIYGFLLGVVESQGEIQRTMILDCFDAITGRYSDNTVLYRQWKSNARHKTAGYRIKTTRFILPGFQSESWNRSLSHGSMRKLQDFDRVFSMLNGETEPDYGLVQAFQHDVDELRNGGRVSTSYFDIRWYPGCGSLHVFPKSKALMDTMNRYVGRERQWIPSEPHEASKDFWKQYDRAEAFDKEIRAEIKKSVPTRGYWGSPIDVMFRGRDDEKNSAAEAIDKAMESVQVRHGLDIDNLIESESIDLLRLAA